MGESHGRKGPVCACIEKGESAAESQIQYLSHIKYVLLYTKIHEYMKRFEQMNDKGKWY